MDYARAFDCVDHNKLWKIILKICECQNNLTCLLRNLYAGQEATVRTRNGTMDWFQIGKRVHQGCVLSPCLFNFYAEYIMWNAGLEEAQAGIKIVGRNINNLGYTDDTTLMAESEDELKSLLMKVKEESEKTGLKLNIQKTKIMAPGPITSWQIDGETMGTVTDFILRDSKITIDGDCNHEIKRHLLLGRKAMTNLDSMLKSRDITLPTKVCLVEATVFPVVMYGFESWTLKKAECQRIDAFELWCWRRLLRFPWTARRSSQSNLNEISPEYWKSWCWSWSSNTLAIWCKELTHLKRPWCWERLKVGGEGDDRGWDGWMASIDGHEFEQAPGVGDGQGSLACCSPWGHKELDMTEQLNWTDLLKIFFLGV